MLLLLLLLLSRLSSAGALVCFVLCQGVLVTVYGDTFPNRNPTIYYIGALNPLGVHSQDVYSGVQLFAWEVLPSGAELLHFN